MSRSKCESQSALQGWSTVPLTVTSLKGFESCPDSPKIQDQLRVLRVPWYIPGTVVYLVPGGRYVCFMFFGTIIAMPLRWETHEQPKIHIQAAGEADQHCPSRWRAIPRHHSPVFSYSCVYPPITTSISSCCYIWGTGS